MARLGIKSLAQVPDEMLKAFKVTRPTPNPVADKRLQARSHDAIAES